jgi:hypothetical protein
MGAQEKSTNSFPLYQHLVGMAWNENSVNRLEDVTSLMQTSDLIAFFCHLVLIFLTWSFYFRSGLSR